MGYPIMGSLFFMVKILLQYILKQKDYGNFSCN
jgi:hypothetical protein|nr:MAG TPA: hypothetical protein [Caudoviricetes sp.]